ncbi:MAG: glycosyltransferase family 2 protein [Parachlamydiaceae bacterium]|nr:glycosyltransferase family 2 protein [Parachlamydiaceae bacterium]
MITVTILTKNSSKYLRQVLNALIHFDEVLIFDNGSSDSTLDIAEGYPNVRIVKGDFEGFGPTHNRASSLAKNNWILSIDSDEVVTPEMSKEVLSVKLEDDCVYSFTRHNFFNDRWIRWCGWYPDRQIRLYNRTITRFTDAQVHEAIIVNDLRHISFESPIIHYSYETISDFLLKMQSYSTLFAVQNCGKKKSSPFKAFSHGVFAFFKSYILKRGILGGYEGFVISSYNAHTAFYKYLKLYEANTRH